MGVTAGSYKPHEKFYPCFFLKAKKKKRDDALCVNQVNNSHFPEHLILDCTVVSLKEADSHLDILRFKPITLRVRLPAQQRKAHLPQHSHSLIKTAKGEDHRGISS